MEQTWHNYNAHKGFLPAQRLARSKLKGKQSQGGVPSKVVMSPSEHLRLTAVDWTAWCSEWKDGSVRKRAEWPVCKCKREGAYITIESEWSSKHFHCFYNIALYHHHFCMNSLYLSIFLLPLDPPCA